jgi:hypothetical protein
VAKPKGEIQQVDNEFELLKQDPKDLTEVLRDNLGGEALNPFDLDRIQIPSGGILQYQISDVDGQHSVESFDAVIIHWENKRVYWEKAIGDGGGSGPPDCVSEDGDNGVGNPGGTCSQCPFAQFGSAQKGRGQACKQIKMLFVLPRGSLLPSMLNVPPTSIGAIKKYFLRLSSKLERFHRVVTTFHLEPATNASGTAFARISLAKASSLSDSEITAMTAYRDQLMAGFERASASQYAENVPAEEPAQEPQEAAGETAAKESTPF